MLVRRSLLELTRLSQGVEEKAVLVCWNLRFIFIASPIRLTNKKITYEVAVARG